MLACLIYRLCTTKNEYFRAKLESPRKKTRIFIPTIIMVTSLYWPPSWHQASMGMFTFSYRSSLLRVFNNIAGSNFANRNFFQNIEKQTGKSQKASKNAFLCEISKLNQSLAVWQVCTSIC